VQATQVARRAGHGVAVLLKIYAHCIDGHLCPCHSAANRGTPLVRCPHSTCRITFRTRQEAPTLADPIGEQRGSLQTEVGGGRVDVGLQWIVGQQPVHHGRGL